MLSAAKAAELDERLFATRSVEDLMNIAGNIVASIVCAFTSDDEPLAFACGPGNNGGDGLVAAAVIALKNQHRSIEIYCPKTKLEYLLEPLRAASNVKFVEQLADSAAVTLVDCVFGFSQKLPLREPYEAAVRQFSRFSVISVDVPTGYMIDEPTIEPEYIPQALISLTAPKFCHEFVKSRGTRCFVGGNFCPAALATEFGIEAIRMRMDGMPESFWYEDK